MLENEEWVPIKDFESYFISNFGNVRHSDKTLIRKTYINLSGFPTVVLYGHGGSTRYVRHINKLVAAGFLPEPEDPKKNYIWHYDGDLLNCHVSNLKWEYRGDVLEWNDMHRSGTGKYDKFGRVRNNATGVVYNTVYDCAITEGYVERKLALYIDKVGRHPQATHSYLDF